MAAQGAPRPLTRRRQDSHLQPPTPSAVLALSEWLILTPQPAAQGVLLQV